MYSVNCWLSQIISLLNKQWIIDSGQGPPPDDPLYYVNSVMESSLIPRVGRELNSEEVTEQVTRLHVKPNHGKESYRLSNGPITATADPNF